MDNLTKQRLNFIKATQVLMFKKVRVIQSLIYAEILDSVLSVKTDDDNKIKITAGNIAISEQVRLKVNSSIDRESKGLISWILKKFSSLFNINKRNYRKFDNHTETADERALKTLMLRYGFDVKTGKIIKGGYLAQIASSDSIALMAAKIINESVSAQITLPAFRKRFSTIFKGGGGLGIVDAHFYRFTGDVFAEFDRATNTEYAKELDLQYFVYAGTAKDNTRPFCCERLNKVFHASELERWESMEWKGKNKNAPVSLALGGYNCRHMLNFISKELAEKLSGGNINQLNKGCK